MTFLRNHFSGFFAILILGLMAFGAVFAYFLAPDSSPYANQMNPALATLSPGTKVQFVHLHKEMKSEKVGVLQGLLFGTPPKTEMIAASKIDRLDNDWLITELASGMEKQFSQHQVAFTKDQTFHLGSDRYGRDLLSRLLIATRVSFIIGFIAVSISLFIGVPMGLMAGYFGGWVDKVVMWLVNVLWTVPSLLLVIALTLALGKGLFQVFLAIGLTMWVEVARVVRGQVKSLRTRPYVEVAQMMGFSHFRVMFKHILPGVWHPVIVLAAANFATAILLESGLSFLGYGAQPPTPTWGGMVKDHWPFLLMGKAYLVLWPGVCIVLLVLACMLLGNALRDQTDPRREN
ncbi:MAG: ABC transporter permease [Flavobacteriales bacterium]|nr:MAG: ABC transporter permease [Flavobacteriales bacterium]